MTFYNLFPRTLVMILVIQFIKEIGLKSFIEEGLLTLGTKVIKALLMG
jgi:hypothetical protein